MAKPSKPRSFNSGKYGLDVKKLLNLKATHLVKQRNSLDSSYELKPHFGRLHLWSHFFGHYPRFMTISENGDKNCFENWELCLFLQFSFHDNQIVQSLHYCASLAHSGIQFFVLPSVTRKCNPKILKLLDLLYSRSIHLQHELIRVSWKMKYLNFERAYFHSGGVACICKAN